MFVDRVRVWSRGGKGGNGCCSFRREKFVPMGGPDGGDGGKGGDVILEVDPHMNNLVHLRLSPHHFAEKGRNGEGRQCTGRQGRDLIIKVPPGTSVYQVPIQGGHIERAGIDADAVLVADLTEPNQRHVLSEGGRGGRGNRCFKSSINQAPRRTDAGKPGTEGQYLFVLKSIADVGLVGLPNAGKSSLLAALSAARPKIAPYPFTTLAPMVGVVDMSIHDRFTLADIPGLIEGAHQGIGLGHDFLKHIERCRVLAHVIDMAGSEGRDPVEDYRQIRTELKCYDAALSTRPHLVIANKMDLPEAAAHLKNFKRKFRRPIFPISILQSEGLDPLRQALADMLADAA
jgi:GTPase